MERAVGQTELGISGDSTEGWGFAALSDLSTSAASPLHVVQPMQFDPGLT